MPILLLLHSLVCSLSGNIIIFSNPSFFPSGNTTQGLSHMSFLPCCLSTYCRCEFHCPFNSLCMVCLIQPQRMFNKLFYGYIVLNQWWVLQNQISFLVRQKSDCIAPLLLYCNHLCVRMGSKVTLRKKEFSYFYMFRLSFMFFLSVPDFSNNSYSFSTVGSVAEWVKASFLRRL